MGAGRWWMLKRALKLTGSAVKYGCIAHCILEFVGDFVVCWGSSMEPTIYSGDILLTEHISTALHNYVRGDVIIVRSPNNPSQYICKRIVALPGERVDKTVVPKGHLWLGGDNRSNSVDSWTYGPVPQGLVRGRAICKVWPLQDAGSMTDR